MQISIYLESRLVSFALGKTKAEDFSFIALEPCEPRLDGGDSLSSGGASMPQRLFGHAAHFAQKFPNLDFQLAAALLHPCNHIRLNARLETATRPALREIALCQAEQQPKKVFTLKHSYAQLPECFEEVSLNRGKKVTEGQMFVGFSECWC